MKSTHVLLALFCDLFLCLTPAFAYGAEQSALNVAAPEDVAANARWAEAAFGDAVAPAQAANRLTLIHEDVAGDTKIGRCGFGTSMRLADKTYTRGIGVNSRSVLRVSTAQPAARFVADIGLDRNVDNAAASVTMHVSVDGKDLFQTPVLRPDGTMQTIDVAIGGATSFDLVVSDGGDGRGWDQADWADARVFLQDGTELWLDDLANQTSSSDGVPFSFVYGGQPSSDILPRWQRQASTEPISATRTRRILTLTDPATGLEVRAVATIYVDTPGVDWTLHFTNKGQRNTPVIEQVRAVDTSVSLGLGTTPVLHRLRGSMCAADRPGDVFTLAAVVAERQHV